MRTSARRRGVAAAAAVAVSAVGLTACSGGGGSAAEATCTNEIKQPDAAQVTVWAWYPAFESVVDNFNEMHTDLQVCWTNAGQGADEYNKFQTAIEAGTGAPDVIMLEAEVLPTFTILESLVDLSEYGAAELEGDYTAGSWSDVSNGDAVYAIPVDGGPMGMLYRTDIFEEYGVEVPTTWDEFATAAQDLRDAGFEGHITDFPTNGNALNYALFAQNGWEPFQYDAAKPTEVGITVDSPEAEEVLSYWKGLIDDDLVATEDAFTTDYNAALVDGTYAVYLAAAWGPGYLQGLSEADADAEWRAAPLPQWDPENPVQVNWGGSTFAVTTQSEQPEAAATVAKELFDTDEAWKLGVEEAALWPQWKPMLESDWFTGLEAPFFGGQKINEEVFLDAANGYEGFSFSPFQVYAYDQQTQALYDMVQNGTDAATALGTVQDGLVQYATEQGFTVSE
ncbi:ABC transporter substrate-binding protein [Promicromonospora kroppenstedtii]|uniref:ABC transporter substrate-binding protein n=1 Tax=Promicromonospora kroppenstedtii TaxID=440482 RepID=UPI0004AF0F98|nr:extracellular solute-binding protein [Promicromonospora kroppenstedtii]